MLMSVLGVFAFLLFSNTLEFQDTVFTRLFPKPPSQAASSSETVRELTNQLLQTAKELKDKPDKKQEVEVKLVGIAQQRKAAMLAATTDDPNLFLQNALSKKIRDRLPKAVAQFVEEEVSVRGEPSVIIGDDFEHGRSETTYGLGAYTVYFTRENTSAFFTENRIELSGFALDSILVADPNRIKNLPQQVLARQTGSTERKVAVQLINFTDNTSRLDREGNPITVDNVREKLFSTVASATPSANTYYLENSMDKVAFTGTVFDWQQIDTTSASCTLADIFNWAKLANEKNNVNQRDYDHMVYVFPQIPSCNQFANAQGDYITPRGTTPRVWLYGSNIPFTYIHELGHNLGFAHAGLIQCSSKAIEWSGTTIPCPKDYEGDLFDIMGYRSKDIIGGFFPHMNAPHKDKAGWINVRSIKRNVDFVDLIPIESPSSGTHALSIPIGQSPRIIDYYFVEYRQPIGFDNHVRVR